MSDPYQHIRDCLKVGVGQFTGEEVGRLLTDLDRLRQEQQESLERWTRVAIDAGRAHAQLSALAEAETARANTAEALVRGYREALSKISMSDPYAMALSGGSLQDIARAALVRLC